ncbi:hypothetical protein H4J46_16775 [Colwellia sp. MB02u-6]|uniref:hypothetical protein n=1 Tax=Colwellia sp. MB02u-6 TaxID=2759824 RepID=UPI0015F3C5F2|nr:hypothetical protein [Colwellia sp. MB02u-6]MBA6329566.1 hypothetical protein [Colwellia sp. MB02u-6]
MSNKRLVAMESFDSNTRAYKWIEPEITKLGWDVWSIPTTELIDFLGVSSYLSAFINVIKEVHPHVVLVTSPYDFLGSEAYDEIRALGIRVICLSDDVDYDPSYWNSIKFINAIKQADLWLVNQPFKAPIAAGALMIPWVTTAESLAVDDHNAPFFEVVLFGDYSSQRESLVLRLAKHMNIACFGKGWIAGEVTRGSRLGLMRRARTVILVSEENDFSPEFMIEAAMIGANFIVELHSDLARHFVDPEALNTYHSDEECFKWITSECQAKPAPTPIGWNVIWPRITDKLSLKNRAHEQGISSTLALLYAAIARFNKERGQHRIAKVCLEHWIKADPSAPEPVMQIARYAYLLEDWEAVVQNTKDAEVLLLSKANAWFDDQFETHSGLNIFLELRCLRIRSNLQLGDDEAVLTEIAALNDKDRHTIYLQLKNELQIRKLNHVIKAFLNDKK